MASKPKHESDETIDEGARAEDENKAPIVLQWNPTWTEDQLLSAIAFGTGMTDRRAIQNARWRRGGKHQEAVIDFMRRINAPVPELPASPAAPSPQKSDAEKMSERLLESGHDSAVDLIGGFLAGQQLRIPLDSIAHSGRTRSLVPVSKRIHG